MVGERPTIAVDYDGTLEDGRGNVNEGLIARLKAEQARGAVVILWTCRSGRRLQEAVTTLARHGFQPNLVNQNTPQTVARIGYDPRKVLADVYIDDKAARP